MWSVPDVLARCRALARALPPLDVALHDAVGCTLAAPVAARVDLPWADVADCCGYAVRTADLTADGVARLRVLADAGPLSGPSLALTAGATVRASTGAALPPGADAVVPLGRADARGRLVAVRGGVEAGAHVRRSAADIRSGTPLLDRGARIGPRQVGLLAAAGLAWVPVHPRPRVVVVPAGADLLAPGRAPRPGRSYEANGHALTAAAHEAGASAYRVDPVPEARLREVIEDQVVRADLLVVTGGLGRGHDDTVAATLAAVGEVRVDDVALAPGGRFGVGTLAGTTVVVALPGEPVATQLAFELLVRPMVRSMAGEADAGRRVRRAVARTPWRSPAGRRHIVPVALDDAPGGGRVCTPLGDPERPALPDLARATALAVVPEDVTAVEAGDEVECVVLDAPS